MIPDGAMAFAAMPERRRAGQSGRDTYPSSRRRKLTVEQVATIRVEADNRTLRELAAEFGVSHETVRAVLRATP